MKECPKCGRKAAVKSDNCIYCGAALIDYYDPSDEIGQGKGKREPKKHYYHERRKLGKAMMNFIYVLGSAGVLGILILLIALNGGFDFLKESRELSDEDQMYYELSEIQAAMRQARLDLTSYPDFALIVDATYLRGVTVVSRTSTTIVTETARYQLMDRGNTDTYSIYAETKSGSAHITIDQSSPDSKYKMKKRRR